MMFSKKKYDYNIMQQNIGVVAEISDNVKRAIDAGVKISQIIRFKATEVKVVGKIKPEAQLSR